MACTKEILRLGWMLWKRSLRLEAGWWQEQEHELNNEKIEKISLLAWSLYPPEKQKWLTLDFQSPILGEDSNNQKFDLSYVAAEQLNLAV